MSKVGKKIDKSVTTDNIVIDGENSTIENTSGDLTINPGSGQKVVVSEQLDVDNLNLDGNTLSSTDTNGDINITPDGTGEVVAGGALNVDNVKIDGNTISSTDVDGDINLTPNGTGSVVVNGDLDLTTSSLTVGGELDVDNIKLSGETISTTSPSTSLELSPTGNVNINSAATISGTLNLTAGAPIINAPNGVEFQGGTVTIDNIDFDGGTISTNSGDLTINPTGDIILTGVVQSSSIQTPAGSLTIGDASDVITINGTAVSLPGLTVTESPSGTANITGTGANTNIDIAPTGTGVLSLEAPVLMEEQATPATGPTVPSGFGSFYPGDDGKAYFKNDDGTVTQLGAGAGGINYISNPDAESNTAGWSLYFDGGDTPTTGNGGPPPGSISLSRNTSSPLRGTADFQLAKIASNGQGAGISYDFTIDNADQAKVLRISFDYSANSGFEYNEGTAADPSDLVVYIYDITNGVLIQPTQFTLDGSGKFISEFQTASDSISYRLILHVATTNASAWTFNFDNVQVGPREIARNYLPNRSWTNKLTSDLTTDTTGISDLEFDQLVVGRKYQLFYQGFLRSVNGDDVVLRALHDGNIIAQLAVEANDGVNTDIFISGTQSEVFTATATTVTFNALIPTASSSVNGNDSFNETFAVLHEVNDYEGSSTVGVSSDFGSRVIAGRFTRASAQSVPNATQTTVIFDTEAENSGGLSLDNTTGIVTVQEPGYYYVSALTAFDNIDDADRSLTYLYVNSTSVARWDSYSSNENDSPSSGGATVVKLSAGDEIKVNVFHDEGTNRNLTNSTERVQLNIFKIQSPQTLMGSETVAFETKSKSSQAATCSAFDDSANVVFTTANFDTTDTHGAFDGTTFTAPVSGYYQMKAGTQIDGSSETLGQFVNVSFYVNASQVSNSATRFPGAVSGLYCSHSDLLKLEAGDAVTVRLQSNITSPSLTSSSTVGRHHFSGFKI
jgi:hypothetical protein